MFIAMNKTTELYYESAYITEFDAEVIACVGNEDGRFEVILDRTAFFPEQGGQSSDLGVLLDDNGSTVDVVCGVVLRRRAGGCPPYRGRIIGRAASPFVAVVPY